MIDGYAKRIYDIAFRSRSNRKIMVLSLIESTHVRGIEKETGNGVELNSFDIVSLKGERHSKSNDNIFPSVSTKERKI